MTPAFIDIEATSSKTVTLKKMTLREYIRRSQPYGFGVAIGDEDPTWIPHSAMADGALEFTRAMFERDDLVWIAHNASFDFRYLVHKYGLPYPKHWLCTLEASMCAFPNHPGGYSLGNLGVTLGLGAKTGKGDALGKMTELEMAEYCKQDVRLCRDIFNVCAQVIPDVEWRIGEICSRVKEIEIHINGEAVEKALVEFTDQADRYGTALVLALDDDQQDAVGVDRLINGDGDEETHVRSVKPTQMKRLLLENLGFATRSISQKKLNHIAVANHPDGRVREALEAGSKSNKALWHKRSVNRFRQATVLDAELNWHGSHTGRRTSRSRSGRGLNLHNMAKHDKEIAALVRAIYTLGDGYCMVRADEANVEYRVNGLLSKSGFVKSMFEGDIFTDPYSTFGQSCTGQIITKAMPVRQLFKAAVLGLGYGMGLETWIKNLILGMTKKIPDFTLADLQQTCETQRWPFPHGRYAKGLLSKLGVDPAVLVAAYHTRRLFHEIHPEMKQLADWLVMVATRISQGCDQADVDALYEHPAAPLPDMVRVVIHPVFEPHTMAIYVGDWPHPAVVWRDLGVRDLPGRGPSLSWMNGMRGYRGLYASIAIENLVQAASAIRTKMAELQLEELGWPYLFSVHDEIMPVCPKNPEDCLRARADLLTVLGPNRADTSAWRWAVVINPAEINVSKSFYEIDVGKLDKRFPSNAAWWGALADHPELLDVLP